VKFPCIFPVNREIGRRDSVQQYESSPGLPEPQWPEVTFQDLVKIAFKDHFIRDLDHPVVRRLRGA